jgi:hypothetical protein
MINSNLNTILSHTTVLNSFSRKAAKTANFQIIKVFLATLTAMQEIHC